MNRIHDIYFQGLSSFFQKLNRFVGIYVDLCKLLQCLCVELASVIWV